MPRRRPGTLLPIEVDILDSGLALRRGGVEHFHGFQLASAIADGGVARRLTAHGTLYKALGRLEDMGLLVSEWEDPEVAIGDGRPRRRLYEVTGEGERVHARWRQDHPQPLLRPHPGVDGA